MSVDSEQTSGRAVKAVRRGVLGCLRDKPSFIPGWHNPSTYYNIYTYMWKPLKRVTLQQIQQQINKQSGRARRTTQCTAIVTDMVCVLTCGQLPERKKTMVAVICQAFFHNRECY